jgi:hypothetical protein
MITSLETHRDPSSTRDREGPEALPGTLPERGIATGGLLHCHVMRRGVDGFSPSSWEPQEEGMMSTAASFSLSKKPRFVSPGKSQTPKGDAC